MNILVLASVGLRASLTIAALVVMALYVRPFLSLMRCFVSRHYASGDLKTAAAMFVGGAYSVFFVGKRVFATLVSHENLYFDTSRPETVGTCIGLGLGVAFYLMVASANFEYRGRQKVALTSVFVSIAAGIAFALFYGVIRHLI